VTDTIDQPRRVAGYAPLTARERRSVAVAAVAPVPGVFVALLPFMLTGATVSSLLGAAMVYGSLLGLAAGFVAVDRFHARQCGRCRERTERRALACAACGYDLVERPRFACPQRHTIYLDEGLCACGRRLAALPSPRGVGREVVLMLRVGGWLLAFLMGVGVLLRLLEG